MSFTKPVPKPPAAKPGGYPGANTTPYAGEKRTKP